MLGMLATPITQSAGIRFLLVTATICLWPIGTQLVDLILYGVGAHVFAIALGAGAAGAAGAIGTATATGISLTTVALPALVICMAFAAFVPIAMYLAVPIFFHVVMQGGSPVTAALSSGFGLARPAAELQAWPQPDQLEPQVPWHSRSVSPARIVHAWRQRIIFCPTAHCTASAKRHSAVGPDRRRECGGRRSRQTRRRRLYGSPGRVIQLCARRPSSGGSWGRHVVQSARFGNL